MSNLFSNARPGDKFRNREGHVVSFVEEDGGFYFVSPNGEEEYGVHADGFFLRGTANGEPETSHLDVIEKIE